MQPNTVGRKGFNLRQRSRGHFWGRTGALLGGEEANEANEANERAPGF
ncbi:hypothetical protein ANO14919_126930 [Xylariales sp. No.14919]|nr:hypothetical protein ANO14919_126930 [Xylariales sp. No.14919]